MLTTGQPVWITGKFPMLGRLENPKADKSGFVRVSVLQADQTLARGYRVPREAVVPVKASKLELNYSR